MSVVVVLVVVVLVKGYVDKEGRGRRRICVMRRAVRVRLLVVRRRERIYVPSK